MPTFGQASMCWFRKGGAATEAMLAEHERGNRAMPGNQTLRHAADILQRPGGHALAAAWLND